MTKSVYSLNEEAKKKYKTTKNTYDMFPVGSHVKIICLGQDFNFFWGETGRVIKNSGKYLGIIVEYDSPRIYEGGHVEYNWNFKPDDLILFKEKEVEDELIERWLSLCNNWSYV